MYSFKTRASHIFQHSFIHIFYELFKSQENTPLCVLPGPLPCLDMLHDVRDESHLYENGAELLAKCTKRTGLLLPVSLHFYLKG